MLAPPTSSEQKVSAQSLGPCPTKSPSAPLRSVSVCCAAAAEQSKGRCSRRSIWEGGLQQWPLLERETGALPLGARRKLSWPPPRALCPFAEALDAGCSCLHGSDHCPGDAGCSCPRVSQVSASPLQPWAERAGGNGRRRGLEAWFSPLFKPVSPCALQVSAHGAQQKSGVQGFLHLAQQGCRKAGDGRR